MRSRWRSPRSPSGRRRALVRVRRGGRRRGTGRALRLARGRLGSGTDPASDPRAARRRRGLHGRAPARSWSRTPPSRAPSRCRGFAAADGAASVHALSIDDLAVLIIVHAQPNPRGFTGLCQRVAASLADGAGLVVRRALAQEQLSRENAVARAAREHRPAHRRQQPRRLGGPAGARPAGALQRRALRGGGPLRPRRVQAGKRRLRPPRRDELLQRFARCSARPPRSHDFVARIGGDEFAVLLRDCDLAGASAWCERVIDAVDAEYASASGLPCGSRGAAPPPARSAASPPRSPRPTAASTGTRRRKSRPPGRGRGAEAWRSGRGRRSCLTPHTSRSGWLTRSRDWGSYATQIPQASEGGPRLWALGTADAPLRSPYLPVEPAHTLARRAGPRPLSAPPAPLRSA